MTLETGLRELCSLLEVEVKANVMVKVKAKVMVKVMVKVIAPDDRQRPASTQSLADDL
ncbi:hypothetical protein ACFZAV_13775 [Streptomyces sp. NPDC008343]|uniref:hypothetical protein n=1 Tax=Streptomyces sp. NPDC008343 TaxID=3364828 RepID=UPI0036EEB4C8